MQGMPANPAILKMFADEIEDHILKWESACLRLENGSNRSAILAELFRYAHNLKAGSQMAELATMAQLLHRLEDYLVAVKNGDLVLVEESQDLFTDVGAYLKDCLKGLRSGKETNIDTAVIETKIVLLLRGSADPLTPDTPASRSESSAPADQASERPADISTKVKLTQLDQLIRLIGELSIENEMIGAGMTSAVADSLRQSWVRSRKVLKDLQATAISLRMQTLETLFMRLEKTAIDTSRKLGKKVVIRKAGLDVELDKQIIERLTEPLTHMIRNAIDHGIEAGAIRKFGGKNEYGTLILSAHDEGGSIELVIEDDGKGIDAEAVFRKAIEKGLVKADAQLSESEKRQLVFLPGFSTADAVTEFSGRGVGMDVVKTLVDSLGGEIEIQSAVGHGTKFSMRIPTTVSILDALVVDVEGVNYAVPTQDLREIINLADHPIHVSQQENPYVVLRESVVTLRRISEFIRFHPDQVPEVQKPATVTERRPALIVKAGESVVGFPVERILSQQRLHIRPLHESLQGMNGAIGTAILAGGEASVILNLQSIVRKISLGA